MQLIEPSEISGKIMTLIEKTNEKLILVSPYVNISQWQKLLNKFAALEKRTVKIEFYTRKGQRDAVQEILSVGMIPIEVPNLHTKLYMNEKYAIVTSMNLNLSSDTNSLDIGYLTTEKKELEELMEYYTLHLKKWDLSLQKASKPLDLEQIAKTHKNQSFPGKNPVHEPTVTTPDRYETIEKKLEQNRNGKDDFNQQWYLCLKKAYPQTDFKIDETHISAYDFPQTGVNFSNSYGFATFNLNVDRELGRKLKDKFKNEIHHEIVGHRIYWSSPYNRICFYDPIDLKDCIKVVQIMVYKLPKWNLPLESFRPIQFERKEIHVYNFQSVGQLSLREFLIKALSVELKGTVKVVNEGLKIIIKTGANNYQVFLASEKGGSLLRISCALSASQYNYANIPGHLPAWESNLNISLTGGGKGYYDTIWGTSKDKIQSSNIFDLQRAEIDPIADSIIRFVLSIERFKELHG